MKSILTCLWITTLIFFSHLINYNSITNTSSTSVPSQSTVISPFAPFIGSEFKKDFYVIAHMANTPQAVDWAVDQGANGVEMDLRFEPGGDPTKFKHPPIICDCNCGISYGICGAPGGGCGARSDVIEMLNHIAKDRHDLALVVFDCKVSDDISSKVYPYAGNHFAHILEDELFSKGYFGRVIVSVSSCDEVEFLRSLVNGLSFSKNQVDISIDGEGNKVGKVINKLQSVSTNVAYGTGISACIPKQYFSAIYSANGVLNNQSLIYIWTIDDKDSMLKYIDYGANGIITNNPARLEYVRNMVGRPKATLYNPYAISTITEKGQEEYLHVAWNKEHGDVAVYPNQHTASGAKWKLTPLGNGAYAISTITEKGQEEYLHVAWNKEHGNVAVYPNQHTASGAKWKLTPLGNGAYAISTITEKGQEEYLHVAWNKEHGNVAVYPNQHTASGAKWRLTKIP